MAMDALPLIVGLVLSAVVAAFARTVGLDRDRAFYPTVLVVVGSYYVLFAAIGAPAHVLGMEALGLTGFALLAVAGFKRSHWLVAAAIAGHGLFDAVHGLVIANPGVPAWWPTFCAAYDLGAAAWLAMLLVRDRSPRPASSHALGGIVRTSGPAPAETYGPQHRLAVVRRPVR